MAIIKKRSYRITRLFEDLLPGDGAVTERSVLTDQGIKIPDVIWLNPSRAHEIHGTKPIEPAPDICVEVRSPGNSLEELAEKKAAYFRAGPARSECAIKTTSSSFLVPRVKWPNPSFVHDSPIRSNPTFERRLRARFNGNAELLLHPPGLTPELSERPEPPARNREPWRTFNSQRNLSAQALDSNPW
jgi:Putative restriction endonuclease